MTTTEPSPAQSAALPAAAATFLSTEHWGMLGTRSMIWNEAFSRVSTFLNALSAAVVALALVADATGFNRSFRVFALVLLPIIFFLGVTTYVRLTQINSEDVFMVMAMNRLRRAYIDQVPELEAYFSTGSHDDAAGVFQTFILDNPATPRAEFHFFITTPTVVGTIDAAIAGAGGALLAHHVGVSAGWLVASGIGTFFAMWGLLMSVQLRQLTMFRRSESDLSRFPSPEGTDRRLF